jgi:hypothetical protein
MGDRANIFFRGVDGHGIGVYGHWAGEEMPKAAEAVLKNSNFQRRLKDCDYATRIGVQTVLDAIGASHTEETGYGLWTDAGGPGDNEHRFIVIDTTTGDLWVCDKWEAPEKGELIRPPSLANIEKAYEKAWKR